ncbi:MAG TPA: glucokinase [Candidatus Methylomirabilis sp.]|nr:glucokinase [Candidatus Methylomirabilis sp.]
MILAADVGGTSSRIGLFEATGGRLRPAIEVVYPSGGHRGLDEIVRVFLAAHHPHVDHACFAVAGPVLGGRSEAPNLPWTVDARDLAHALDLPTVGLLNDLEANAHGIPALEEKDFLVLNWGSPNASGNRAVISAGTGLGEAGIYWDGRDHHPFAGEGGHADFAPTTDLEVELLIHLRKKIGAHVSWERVVSGPGLAGIYEFLRDTGRGTEPPWLRDALRAGDPPAVISQAASEGRSELAVQALALFASAYGAEAGNLALKLLATGGIYVGGGIAPKIVETLKRNFMEAFLAKGRLRRLLETIPVRVILNDKAALLGAARWMALRAGSIGTGHS